MNCGHVNSVTGPLLGMRELDIIHPWPANWQGFSFDHLLSWIPNTKVSTELPPPPIVPVPHSALSKQQRAAFDLIHDHTFGHSQAEQLLLIVIGTAGTGKSFLINAIHYLFDEKNCAESLKVTAPTGICSSQHLGIHGVFSAVPFEPELVRTAAPSGSNGYERCQVTHHRRVLIFEHR